MQRHFQLLGNTVFLQDTNVILIAKTDLRAPTKMEDYWIHTVKTKAPMGLNVKVITKILSCIIIVQLFVFLDLDGLF